MIINTVILKIISLLHILLLLFIIGTPFIDANYFLLLHIIFIPFLILHWICEEKICVLTLTEKKIRKLLGKGEEDCVSCKLIDPIYDAVKKYKKYKTVIYTATIILWLISVCKMVNKYKNGEITSYLDFFKF